MLILIQKKLVSIVDYILILYFCCHSFEDILLSLIHFSIHHFYFLKVLPYICLSCLCTWMLACCQKVLFKVSNSYYRQTFSMAIHYFYYRALYIICIYGVLPSHQMKIPLPSYHSQLSLSMIPKRDILFQAHLDARSSPHGKRLHLHLPWSLSQQHCFNRIDIW